jgi:hypothetical protein
MTFILAVLALPITFSGASRDTVRVQPKVDSMQVCAPSDSVFSYARPDTVRVQAKVDSVKVSAPVDSVQVLPVKDTVKVSAEADSTSRARIPVVGLSTNIPYDITWVPGYGVTSIPSFSLEFYPGKWKHFTIGADVEWPMWKHWDTHRFMQINNITLWTRRYFRARESSEDSVRGFYLLANINAARYGIGFDADRGWQGEGLGASLGAGHKWTWGRFFVDAGLAVGYFYARYDPYVWGNDGTGWYYYDYTGDPEAFVPRRMALHWFGPTRVYVSIGFDLTKKDRK